MPIDLQNPWLKAGTGGVEPAPGGASPLPPGAWGGLGPGISNSRGMDADLLKWLDPSKYKEWTRDQWRAAMSFGSHTADGNGVMNQLENLIGTHALNNHKNYFNSGGNGYLPGHFDYNTGKMVYNGIDPNLVNEVNNRPFAIQGGSLSGAPVNPYTGALGSTMQTGVPSLSQANMQQGGAYSSKPMPQNPVTSPPPIQTQLNTGSSGPPATQPAGAGAPGLSFSTKSMGTNQPWSANKSPWGTSQGASGPKNPWNRWSMG